MQLLHETVSRQARRRRDATAVAMGGERLSYEELEDASNRLGHALGDLGCQPGDRVCLFMPKSPRAIASMLGVLKAGCSYVPIDASSPAPRVARIMTSSEPRAVVVASAAAQLFDTIRSGPGGEEGPIVVSAEDGPMAGERLQSMLDWTSLGNYPGERPSVPGNPEGVAHILFTSGSTGVPKGVVITHENVLGFLAWANEYFGLQPDDRVSGHSPLSFDLSTFDIFGALSAGAALHLVPPAINLLPHKLSQFISTSELTQWFSVPSVLTLMAKFDAVKRGAFPALKRLLWCGEVLPRPTLAYLKSRLPGVSFTNLYGPTEATIASSYYTIGSQPEDDALPVPIGHPCRGEEVVVLDENLLPTAEGEVGELHIRGAGLSPGYWRDEERTRAAFRSDPASGRRSYATGDLGRVDEQGTLHFVGRKDTQIKSRGYRIELGEIESGLSTLAELKESAVVAIPTDRFEGTLICCAYCPAPGAAPAVAGLRTDLAKILPRYMIPQRWIAYDALPKTFNGKIDRRKLKEAFESHGA